MMKIDEIISNALYEDIGEGDHTSIAVLQPGIKGRANLIAKENGIIAGIDISEKVFKRLDPQLEFKAIKNNGDKIYSGDIVFSVSGKVNSILKSERVALNFIQRMSGIATETAKYVELIKDTNAKILDTRKTTPNMRQLEKLAVKTGGGNNHRMGLYDMIMIKDNHVDFAGGVENAIERAKLYVEKNNLDIKIEIEVRSIDELNKVLKKGFVDMIMLDNFSIPDLRVAVDIIKNKYITEASGGITKKNIREVAETGVDYISVGALTHNIKSLDLSLLAKI